jgi:fucose permease
MSVHCHRHSAILMTAVVLCYLPDRPENAAFLSTEEKAWLTRTLAQEAQLVGGKGRLLPTLWDPRVLALSVVYILINISLFGVICLLPTIVKGFGVTGTQNGLLTSIPWAFAVGLLLWLPRRLRTERGVLLTVTAMTAIGLTCFLSSALLGQDWMRFTALAIGVPCISILFPCFWTFPPRYFQGRRSASGIGAISTIGLLGGFIAQNVMPWVAQASGRAVTAMIIPSACLAGVGLMAVLWFIYLQRARPRLQQA